MLPRLGSRWWCPKEKTARMTTVNRCRGRGHLQAGLQAGPGGTAQVGAASPEPAALRTPGRVLRTGKDAAGAGDGTAPPGTAQLRSALPAVGGAKRAGLKRHCWCSGNSTVWWWDFYLSGSERCCDLAV